MSVACQESIEHVLLFRSVVSPYTEWFAEQIVAHRSDLGESV